MRLWWLSAVCLIVVVEVDLLSAAVVSGSVQPVERQVTAGRETPLAWPASLRAGRHRRSAQGKEFQYAVVVDAGSSGSRVRVYRWPTPSGKSRVAVESPWIENNYTKKIEPGLSGRPMETTSNRSAPTSTVSLVKPLNTYLKNCNPIRPSTSWPLPVSLSILLQLSSPTM